MALLCLDEALLWIDNYVEWWYYYFFSSHSLLPPSLALGLVLHNGVNLSYAAGTSVTWRPCLRDQFIQMLLLSLREKDTSISACRGSVIWSWDAAFFKDSMSSIMRINCAWKNPGACICGVRTRVPWNENLRSARSPTELAGPGQPTKYWPTK